MQPIIEVKNVSKKYRLSEAQPYYTLRDSLAGLFKNPFTKKNTQLGKDEFWALDDVSFNVMPGEVIGIIGRNGAGKSTLLKILSQITPPTEGEVIMRGRVGSLLEVGTGFSPELTGRENIYLNGAILGMSRAEVRQKFDEIVAFSEVEKFLDTPLKRYSSGMYMRLAFAVAAHLETEILIVDEVLAVGDAEFQKKALGKMGEVTKQGRTVLFVSHNLLTVQNLCDRALFLESGVVRLVGKTNKVINQYSSSAANPQKVKAVKASLGSLSEDAVIRFDSIVVANQQGSVNFKSSDSLKVELEYSSEKLQPLVGARVVVSVVSEFSENIVLRLDSDIVKKSIEESISPSGKIICEAEKINLTEGNYYVNIDFLINGTSKCYIVAAAKFSVITDLDEYGYKLHPDKTVCDNVIKYFFKSKEKVQI